MLGNENQRIDHKLHLALLYKQIDHILDQRFQVLQSLATNSQVVGLLSGSKLPDNPEIRLVLNTTNKITKSELIWIMNNKGIVQSSSDYKGGTLTGVDYSFRPYFISSMAGKADIFPAVGAVTGTRGLYLSTPVHIGQESRPSGVIALKINIREINKLLESETDIKVLVSPEGVILFSNRPDWVLHTLAPLNKETLSQFQATRQFGKHRLLQLKWNLNDKKIELDHTTYQIIRQSLQIYGWQIISCRPISEKYALTNPQKYQIIAALCITGSLAILVFFLLVNIQYRRKTEKMLRRAEEKYHSIFENAIVGIFQITLDGKFVEASPSLSKILGYQAPRNLIGEISSIEKQIYACPADYREFHRLLLNQDMVDGFQTRFYRKNGETIWMSLSARVVRNTQGNPEFLEGFCVDITKRKHAQENLRRENAITTQIMNTSPVGITLVNRDGLITFANAKAQQIMGIPSDEITKLLYNDPKWKINDFNGNPLPDKRLPFAVVMQTRQPVHDIRYAIHLVDGQKVFLSINAAPIFDESGAVSGMVSTLEDITQKVQSENDAEFRQRQLAHADRMISLGILVSGIAHEINNPNTFIMSNAYLFADAWQQAQAILDEYHKVNGDFLIGGIQYSMFQKNVPMLCSRIIEGSQRIKTIIKEMHDYARNDSIQMDESVNMSEVIKSAGVLLSNMIKKSTNHPVFELEKHIPSIHGNFQRLEQVIINIVQNACQSLPDRGKSILIRTTFEDRSNSVLIVCKDEGVGISKESIGHITDPFFSTKRDMGGMGLGLSISANIVHEHGGSLDFQSTVGIGTTVTLRLPIVR